MAGAPGVPKPARMHTKAGAEAFARHYMTVVDRTGMHPKSGELEPLGLRECKSCDAYEGNVAYLEGNGLHNSGPAAKLRRSAVQDGDHGKDVFLKVDQLPITLLTKDGRVAESDPAVAGIVLVFHLKWTAGGWRISEIQKSAIGMPT